MSIPCNTTMVITLSHPWPGLEDRLSAGLILEIELGDYPHPPTHSIAVQRSPLETMKFPAIPGWRQPSIHVIAAVYA